MGQEHSIKNIVWQLPMASAEKTTQAIFMAMRKLMLLQFVTIFL